LLPELELALELELELAAGAELELELELELEPQPATTTALSANNSTVLRLLRRITSPYLSAPPVATRVLIEGHPRDLARRRS
jgi:hypothetical protein